MSTSKEDIALPRIAFEYCTQCRWMLRAAYFAQELLTTFNTAIGEVALVPTTGGIFKVTLIHNVVDEIIADCSGGGILSEAKPNTRLQTVVIWDRKEEGGFPETKVLKQRIRDFIEPERNLGHSDKQPPHSA